MITYLLHDAINRQKYDTCIANATYSKVYAFSWYLDSVTENWDVLVLDDYLAVMPLPKKKKYGITYIFQPFWMQHLGIFSKSSLSDVQNADFLKSIPKKFRLIDFNINFKWGNSEERFNYILPLHDDYKTLFKLFSKLRKRSVTKAINKGILLKEVSEWGALLNIFNKNKERNFEISEESFSKFEILLDKAKELNQLKIVIANSENNQLLGGAFFIFSNRRITYLFSVINKKGRDLQAMSFIINSIIQEYSETHYILDFEGSMLPGVAKFIKSFGAQKELYHHYKKWRLF